MKFKFISYFIFLFNRYNTYVFATEPFWFCIWFGESCFEYDLLVFAFLCMLVNKWAQEAVCLLFMENSHKIIIKIDCQFRFI